MLVLRKRSIISFTFASHYAGSEKPVQMSEGVAHRTLPDVYSREVCCATKGTISVLLKQQCKCDEYKSDGYGPVTSLEIQGTAGVLFNQHCYCNGYGLAMSGR